SNALFSICASAPIVSNFDKYARNYDNSISNNGMARKALSKYPPLYLSLIAVGWVQPWAKPNQIRLINIPANPYLSQVK
ncbi:hypothetical protein, partial [Arthrospira sp. PCC 8006]|uniref:hypothetical protein n=1 Tax=Arthrospira sp. PCC 8006 TaxID=1982224 RepID=UPI00396F6735